MMSSMWSAALVLPLIAIAAPATAQYAPAQPVARPYVSANAGYALNDWRRLRENSGYTFADYARFLLANPDWPDEAKLRRWAERAMRPGENPTTVISFFAQEK